MRRSGKSDFWGIYHFLPRETRGYVPAFIGATYMMSYYKEHNLVPKRFDFAPYSNYDTVKVNRWVHFEQIAALTGIPLHILRDLNPQYRRDIVPGNERPYTLKLPIAYIGKYIDTEEQIPLYQSDKYNPVLMAAPAASTYNSYYAQAVVPAGAKRIKHTVKSGETLGVIAALYSVKVSDLRMWNRIRGNTIYAGRKLNIYVKQPRKTAAQNNKTVEQNKKTSSSGGQLISQDGHLCHQVKSGDTLWNISQRYKYLGINLETIKNLNNIDELGTLSTGMLLKIKKI
jgi:membrane-bound lytic murein transglycosylase D